MVGIGIREEECIEVITTAKRNNKEDSGRNGKYYTEGENKLRSMAEEHPEAKFIIMNGNRILIKRQKFEEYLDNATVV